MDVTDIIDITNSDVENIQLNTSNHPTSKPLGEGVELLMNMKHKDTNGNSVKLDLSDVSDLERDLNDLSNGINMSRSEKSEVVLKNIGFSQIGKESSIGEISSNINDVSETKTWDGFKKIELQSNPDVAEFTKKLTPEETLREKFKTLRRLEEIQSKGGKLTKQYSMESSLSEMQGEYETIISEKERTNSCKFQGRMLMAAITGIEFLNNRFDPFDIKLDGWSEQLNENINDYDEIFSELHEKYKTKAKMAPELKLMFQLAGSGIMVHMTNTMFKSAVPGMDDILRQNPELAKQFTQAAVNTMGAQNPGFGGFMNNFMPGAQGNGGGGHGMSHQPTHNTNTSSQQRSFTNDRRPFEEPITDLNTNGNKRELNYGGGEKSQTVVSSPEKSSKSSTTRPEMKGPSDINDLLSGLKIKKPDVKNKTNHKRSDKNTVSLDI
jgi:Family of unknown function (DUF5767)